MGATITIADTICHWGKISVTSLVACISDDWMICEETIIPRVEYLTWNMRERTLSHLNMLCLVSSILYDWRELTGYGATHSKRIHPHRRLDDSLAAVTAANPMC